MKSNEQWKTKHRKQHSNERDEEAKKTTSCQVGRERKKKNISNFNKVFVLSM